MAQETYILTTSAPDALGTMTCIVSIDVPAGVPYMLLWRGGMQMQPNWNALPKTLLVFGALPVAVQTLLTPFFYNPADKVIYSTP